MDPKTWNAGEGGKPINYLSIPKNRNDTPIVNALSTRPDTVGENYLVGVGSRAARFRRQQNQKMTIVILTIILIAVLISLIVMAQCVAKKKTKLCETPKCIRSAARLLQSMDETVDPCEDFYQYACGNWYKEYPRPDKSEVYTWFHQKLNSMERTVRMVLAKNISKDDPIPLNQAKQLYKSCLDTKAMDAAGLKPIFDYLQSVDLPPVPTYLNLTKNEKGYNFDWWKSIAKIQKKSGLSAMIKFDIMCDPRNTSKRIIVIIGNLPNTSILSRFPDKFDNIINKSPEKRQKRDDKPDDDKMKDEDVLGDENEEDEDSQEEEARKESFKAMYAVVFKEFLKELNQSSSNKTSEKLVENNINKTIERMTEFRKQLLELDEEMENSTVPINIEPGFADMIDYSVDQLQNLTDELFKKEGVNTKVIWKTYFLTLFDKTNVTMDFEKDLLLLDPNDVNFLLKTSLFVEKIPPIVLELYLWTELVYNFIPYSTSPIRGAYVEYRGKESDIQKSKNCAQTVNEFMKFAVAHGYVREEFYEITRPKVMNMLDNIRFSLEDLIAEASWMDLPTKVLSVEKARKMKSVIGFPKWVLDHNDLQEYYKGFDIHPEKYIQNVNLIRELSMERKLNSYRLPHVFNWEVLDPTDINAFHVPEGNTIAVPLNMMEYPVHDLGIEALNYGALGTILGHELTHGFDNKGRKYDKHGIVHPWWSNGTIEAYINKTDCLVKQYSKFYLEDIDEFVDGNLTLGENIADNVGVKSALRGFWRQPKESLTLPGLGNLSDEQLFFLSYGNLWCETHTADFLASTSNDEHPPNRERVKGTLQNTPEFAKAWNCRANSSMNPAEERCVVF